MGAVISCWRLQCFCCCRAGFGHLSRCVARLRSISVERCSRAKKPISRKLIGESAAIVHSCPPYTSCRGNRKSQANELADTRVKVLGSVGYVQQLVGSARAFARNHTMPEAGRLAFDMHELDMQDDETKDAKLICSSPGKKFHAACW